MDKKANFFNIENLLNAVPSPSGHVLRAVTIKMPHGRSLFPPFGKNFKQAELPGFKLPTDYETDCETPHRGGCGVVLGKLLQVVHQVIGRGAAAPFKRLPDLRVALSGLFLRHGLRHF
jgi:hypothetical protein